MMDPTTMSFWVTALALLWWYAPPGDTQFCQARAPASGTRYNGTVDTFYRPGEVLTYSCDVGYQLNHASPHSYCTQSSSDPTTASWAPTGIKCELELVSLVSACCVLLVAVVVFVSCTLWLIRKRKRFSSAPKVKRRRHDPPFLEEQPTTSLYDSVVIDDNQTVVMDDATGQASFVNRTEDESPVGEAVVSGETGDQRPQRPRSTLSSERSHHDDVKTSNRYENVMPFGKQTDKPKFDANRNLNKNNGDANHDQRNKTSAPSLSESDGKTTGNPAGQYDQLPAKKGHDDTHAIETSFPGGGKLELRRPQEVRDKTVQEGTKRKHDYENMPKKKETGY